MACSKEHNILFKQIHNLWNMLIAGVKWLHCIWKPLKLAGEYHFFFQLFKPSIESIYKTHYHFLCQLLFRIRTIPWWHIQRTFTNHSLLKCCSTNTLLYLKQAKLTYVRVIYIDAGWWEERNLCCSWCTQKLM